MLHHYAGRRWGSSSHPASPGTSLMGREGALLSLATWPPSPWMVLSPESTPGPPTPLQWLWKRWGGLALSLLNPRMSPGVTEAAPLSGDAAAAGRGAQSQARSRCPRGGGEGQRSGPLGPESPPSKPPRRLTGHRGAAAAEEEEPSSLRCSRTRPAVSRVCTKLRLPPGVTAGASPRGRWVPAPELRGLVPERSQFKQVSL